MDRHLVKPRRGRPPKPKAVWKKVLEGEEPKTAAEVSIANQRSEDVKIMASTGSSEEAMAQLLGIPVEQLQADYREELAHGTEYTYAVISLKLVKKAFEGDNRSMMAWMRQFGGWMDVSRQEITGKDGEPISIRSLDVGTLSQIVASLSQKGIAGRSQGRIGAAKSRRGGEGEVIDLDPISGATDEGDE